MLSDYGQALPALDMAGQVCLNSVYVWEPCHLPFPEGWVTGFLGFANNISILYHREESTGTTGPTR